MLLATRKLASTGSYSCEVCSKTSSLESISRAWFTSDFATDPSFFTDGEWESVVVDDQLYLKHNQFDDAGWVRMYFRNKEEEYEKNFTKGSKALYFASCADQNETWLPLLEKAYAKFHGDYSALDGGFTGSVTIPPARFPFMSQPKLFIFYV